MCFLVKIKPIILIQCHGNYIEVEKLIYLKLTFQEIPQPHLGVLGPISHSRIMGYLATCKLTIG